MAGTPRSAKSRGKKPVWYDLDETHGSLSMPSTPMASRTQFSHELVLGGTQENNEKRSIIARMQDKVKKWKNVTPPYYKKKHGRSQKGSKLGNTESLKSMKGLKDEEEEYQEENPEFHGAPMYESELAPDIYKQGLTDLRSLLKSPPQLSRCKSQRPRPGFKSEIEEILDMNRTKSDPLQLKPTKSEIEEICDMQRTKSDPLQLNPNKDSNGKQYKLMIEEISEILEPASYPISKATQEQVDDSTEMEMKPKPYRFNPINFSRQLELSETDKTSTANPISSKVPKKATEFVTEAESPTAKVLSEAALMIADSSQIEIKPESYQLNQTHDHALSLSAPIKPCKPVTEKLISTSFLDDNMISSDINTTNTGDKTVSEAVNEILTPAFNVLREPTDKMIEVNETLKREELHKPELALLDLNKPVDLALISTKFVDSTDPDKYKTESVGLHGNTVSEKNDTITEPTINLIKPETDVSDLAPFKLNESANSEPVSENVVDQTTDRDDNSTNRDDYKTEGDKITELVELESKLICPKEPDVNLKKHNNNTNDADYKTVIDAVGEIMSPVYSRISDLTNKLTEAGCSSGLSIREYLKNKRVVDMPVSSNPHAEEVAVEESDADGRRLQASAN